jgi:predicted peptidase
MLKLVTVACVGLLVGWSSADARLSQVARMQAHTLDETPYRLFVPVGYRADRTYPLVLFLHGGGGRGTDNVSQLGEGNGLLVDLFLERGGS